MVSYWRCATSPQYTLLYQVWGTVCVTMTAQSLVGLTSNRPDRNLSSKALHRVPRSRRSLQNGIYIFSWLPLQRQNPAVDHMYTCTCVCACRIIRSTGTYMYYTYITALARQCSSKFHLNHILFIYLYTYVPVGSTVLTCVHTHDMSHVTGTVDTLYRLWYHVVNVVPVVAPVPYFIQAYFIQVHCAHVLHKCVCT